MISSADATRGSYELVEPSNLPSVGPSDEDNYRFFMYAGQSHARTPCMLLFEAIRWTILDFFRYERNRICRIILNEPDERKAR